MPDERHRERDIVESLIGLADRLVEDFDILDLTIQLTEDCARVLDVAAAGLLLADPAGVLHLLAATSRGVHAVEVLQLQRDEGPCLDCFASGSPVNVADLAEAADRWPRFAATALGEGFASVHAIPLRLRDQVLGALGLFGTKPGALSDDDLTLAQALAHVASIAISQQGHTITRGTLLPGLQIAVASRGVLEMARGVVAEVLDTDVDEALERLRRYSRDSGTRLTEVAQRLVSPDTENRQQILDHLASFAEG